MCFTTHFSKKDFCKNVPFSFENFSHHHGRSSDGNETFSNFSTKKWKKRKRKQTATLHAKYSGKKNLREIELISITFFSLFHSIFWTACTPQEFQVEC